MEESSQQGIKEKIKDCHKCGSPEKVILCLEELLKNTNDAQVAYALGYEHERIHKYEEAIKYYEQAESLFTDTSSKNMARFAINNLIVEALSHNKTVKK